MLNRLLPYSKVKYVVFDSENTHVTDHLKSDNLYICNVIHLFFSDKITPQQCIDTWNLLYHITIRQSSTDQDSDVR